MRIGSEARVSLRVTRREDGAQTLEQATHVSVVEHETGSDLGSFLCKIRRSRSAWSGSWTLYRRETDGIESDSERATFRRFCSDEDDDSDLASDVQMMIQHSRATAALELSMTDW